MRILVLAQEMSSDFLTETEHRHKRAIIRRYLRSEESPDLYPSWGAVLIFESDHNTGRISKASGLTQVITILSIWRQFQSTTLAPLIITTDAVTWFMEIRLLGSVFFKRLQARLEESEKSTDAKALL